jgi:hypothetical protein
MSLEEQHRILIRIGSLIYFLTGVLAGGFVVWIHLT